MLSFPKSGRKNVATSLVICIIWLYQYAPEPVEHLAGFLTWIATGATCSSNRNRKENDGKCRYVSWNVAIKSSLCFLGKEFKDFIRCYGKSDDAEGQNWCRAPVRWHRETGTRKTSQHHPGSPDLELNHGPSCCEAMGSDVKHTETLLRILSAPPDTAS